MSTKKEPYAVIATIIKGNTSYNDKKDSGIRRPFPFAAVMITLLCTVMLMFTVYTYVGVSELTGEVKSLEKQVTEMKKSEDKLTSELEARYADIRKRAEGIGMEAAAYEKVYMDAGVKDDISVAIKPESGNGGAINTLLSAVGRNWAKFVEFMD